MIAEPLRTALHDPILIVSICSALVCAAHSIMCYILHGSMLRQYETLEQEIAELQYNRIVEETKKRIAAGRRKSDL